MKPPEVNENDFKQMKIGKFIKIAMLKNFKSKTKPIPI